MTQRNIDHAEVCLPCDDLEATLTYFLDDVGFRLERIFPADNPRVAVLSGYGVRLRLDTAARGDPGRLCLSGADVAADGEETAPNGTLIEWIRDDGTIHTPPAEQRLVHTSARDDAAWVTGRAGMQYRDLIPDRLGGHIIASHIRIPDGGPVPDYVHYHKVRFQLIYCWKGWVKVVYEDQGEPFVMRAGDCVLQPPEIRHRVLESSPGLEVIELTCPAEHETLVDHDLSLPNEELRPERRFGGQRFVRFQAANAEYDPSDLPGFEAADTGIAEATNGIADVRLLGSPRQGSLDARWHKDALRFCFVLEGHGEVVLDGDSTEDLHPGDALTLPRGTVAGVNARRGALRLLGIALFTD